MHLFETPGLSQPSGAVTVGRRPPPTPPARPRLPSLGRTSSARRAARTSGRTSGHQDRSYRACGPHAGEGSARIVAAPGVVEFDSGACYQGLGRRNLSRCPDGDCRPIIARSGPGSKSPGGPPQRPAAWIASPSARNDGARVRGGWAYVGGYGRTPRPDARPSTSSRWRRSQGKTVLPCCQTAGRVRGKRLRATEAL